MPPEQGLRAWFYLCTAASMSYGALTRGRFSCARFAYLVTTATAGRTPLFRDFALARVVIHELYAFERRGECELLTWVLMRLIICTYCSCWET